MGLLSVVELWLKNALDNGVASVTLALAVGAGLYYLAHPYFPDFEPHKSEHVNQVCSAAEAGPKLSVQRNLPAEACLHLQAPKPLPSLPADDDLAAAESPKSNASGVFRSLSISPTWQFIWSHADAQAYCLRQVLPGMQQPAADHSTRQPSNFKLCEPGKRWSRMDQRNYQCRVRSLRAPS